MRRSGRRPPLWLLPGGLVLAIAVAAGAWLFAAGTLDDDDHAGTIGAEALQDGSPVVWAVGDGADGGEAARAVADRMEEEGVYRLLYLGDVYETGTAAEFRDHYDPIYGRFASVTDPTPGNHEWPQHEEGYDPYWREVTGARQPDRYTYDLAGWEIISLNSESPHDQGSAQVRWLRDELGESGTCRLAFWHRPRFSAGTTHGDQADMQPFWEALKGHASIVVTGHEHDMQRFREIDGMTQFVSGAGGHELYRLRANDDRLAFGNDTDFGALRLELSPGVAEFAFVAADGRTLDSGEVPC